MNIIVLHQQFSLQINFLCKKLKVKVSHNKNICRYTVNLFGMELDTLKIETRISKTKLKKPIANVKRMIEQKIPAIEEVLQLLIGFLSLLRQNLLFQDVFFCVFFMMFYFKQANSSIGLSQLRKICNGKIIFCKNKMGSEF